MTAKGGFRFSNPYARSEYIARVYTVQLQYSVYTLDLNFVNDRRCSVVRVRNKRVCTTIVSEGGTLYTAPS